MARTKSEYFKIGLDPVAGSEEKRIHRVKPILPSADSFSQEKILELATAHIRALARTYCTNEVKRIDAELPRNREMVQALAKKLDEKTAKEFFAEQGLPVELPTEIVFPASELEEKGEEDESEDIQNGTGSNEVLSAKENS